MEQKQQAQAPETSQRSVSWGELAALETEFNAQIEKKGATFRDDEHRAEAFADYVQQYIDGNDNPELQIL